MTVNAKVELVALVDAEDIVDGLGNNDEAIISFVVEMINASQSSEVVDRLRERLTEWWEPEGDGEEWRRKDGGP